MKRKILCLFLCCYICNLLCAQTELSTLQRASALADEGKYDDAILVLEEQKHQFQDDESEIFLWKCAMGTYSYFKEDYRASFPYIKECVETCMEHPQELIEPRQVSFLRLFYWLGVCYYKNGQKELAISSWKESLKTLKQYGVSDGEVVELMEQDLCYIENDIDNIAQQVGEAFLCMNAGDYGQAITFYEKALADFKVNTYEHAIFHAQTVQGLCNALYNIGEYGKAESLYLSELGRLDSIYAFDEEVYRDLCDGLGAVYGMRHNYQKSYDYAVKAKSLFERNQDAGDGYIRSLSNCAIAQYNLDNMTEARQYIETAINQAKKNLEIDSNQTIEDFLKAIPTSQKLDTMKIMQDVYLDTKIKPLIAMLSNASFIYLTTGCKAEAIASMTECIAWTERYGIDNVLVMNNLAMLYLKDSNYVEACKYLLKAYEKAKTAYEYDEVAMNLILTYSLSGDKKKAGKIAKESASRLRRDFRKHLF